MKVGGPPVRFASVRSVAKHAAPNGNRRRIPEERTERELLQEKRQRDWFTGQSDPGQDYLLWVQHVEQRQLLESIEKNLNLIEYILFFLAVMLIAALSWFAM